VTLGLPATGLPGWHALLEGRLWDEWAEEGLVFPLDDLGRAVSYLRLKLGTSCRLVVFANPAAVAERPRAYTLRLFPDAARAAACFTKVRALVRQGDEEPDRPFLSARWACVGVPFPHDPELPGLKHVYRAHRLKQALTEIVAPAPGWRVRRGSLRPRLLAYKPGRRAVLRVDLELVSTDGARPRPMSVQLRVCTPAGARRTWSRACAAHRALPPGADWHVPFPLGRTTDRPWIAFRWLPGVSLLERGLELDRAPRIAGEVLARFHALELTTGPPARPERRVRRQAAALLALLPQEDRRITRLADRLCRLSALLLSGERKTVHGDFHAGQVLTGPGGTALLDLDRAGRGDPALDLGGFLAHWHLAGGAEGAAERVLEAYARRSGRTLGDGAVAAATAIGLFLRASEPLRRLDPEWAERVRDVLDRAESCIKPRYHDGLGVFLRSSKKARP